MNSHDCLLTNLRNGIELVLSSDLREVSHDCLVVRSVAAVVAEGLREPSKGYWHVLRDLIHSSTRSNMARHLKHVTSNTDRGIFWIYYTLVEGSLESYMECLVYDVATLKKYYLDSALLRNPYFSTRFLLLLSILSETTLTPLDSFSCPKFPVDSSDKSKDPLLLLRPPSAGGATMSDDRKEDDQELVVENFADSRPPLRISSLQSISLSCSSPLSPGDSGVALISDIDDMYSISEMIIDKTEDDVPMSESEDVTGELWNDGSVRGGGHSRVQDGDKTPTNEFSFEEIVPDRRWCDEVETGDRTPEAYAGGTDRNIFSYGESEFHCGFSKNNNNEIGRSVGDNCADVNLRWDRCGESDVVKEFPSGPTMGVQYGNDEGCVRLMCGKLQERWQGNRTVEYDGGSVLLEELERSLYDDPVKRWQGDESVEGEENRRNNMIYSNDFYGRGANESCKGGVNLLESESLCKVFQNRLTTENGINKIFGDSQKVRTEDLQDESYGKFGGSENGWGGHNVLPDVDNTPKHEGAKIWSFRECEPNRNLTEFEGEEDNRSNLVKCKELDRSFEDCSLSRITEDGVVLRRKKKKKSSEGGEVKRVSFHEDVDTGGGCSPTPRASPNSSRIIRERHSLDPEEEACGFLSQLFSSGMTLLQECGLEALEFDSERFGAFRRSWCAPSTVSNKSDQPIVHLDNMTDSSPAIVATMRDTVSESEYSDLGSVRLRKPPGRELRHKLLRKTLPAQLRSTSKMSLLTRFLRSIPLENRQGEVRARRRSLYLGPRVTLPELDRETEVQIATELREATGTVIPPSDRENRLTEGLKNVLCCDCIYKVFRMLNVEGEPILGVLTSSKLFIMSEFGSIKSIRKCLDYKDLDTVIVGPGAQVVMLVTLDKTSCILFPHDSDSGGCGGHDFCTSLQVAVARCRHAQTSADSRRRLLNFRRLHLADMSSLRERVRQHSGAKNGERLHHYVWVHAEDTVPKLHLTKQAHLMFCIGRARKWQPGLVTLKRNCLTFKSDCADVTYDVNGCTSCDRIATSRPHTFIVKFANRHSVVVATPDDYDMSDWMQCILFAASNKSVKEMASPDGEERGGPTLSGIVVTGDHLVMTRFPDEVVNCTKITDIAAIIVAKTSCVLELDCHEVRDRNGDWILYFSTEGALLEFIGVLIRLHSHIQKLVVPQDSTSPLAEKCEETARELCARFERLDTSYAEL